MKTPAYKQFRLAGYTPACAFRAARMMARFAKLESAGLVRLYAEPEQEDYFSVFGEPDGYDGANGKRVSAGQERKEIEDTLERLGNWVVVTEWRGSEDSEWSSADSVGMCTGYNDPCSPLDNCYVPDLCAEAVRQAQAHAEEQAAESNERSYWEQRDTITQS